MRIKGLLILCVMGLCSPRSGLSSGYRPPFDHALSKAELVVQGDVLDAWSALDGDRNNRFPRERAYRMVVKKCFKGGLKPGDEVFFWDPHYSSTASYRVREKGAHICYLVPAKLTEYEARHISPAGKRFYKPIRVRYQLTAETYSGSQVKDYYLPELKLLDLFVENIPENKLDAYRDLLTNETNSQILLYIIKDWPRPLSDRDIALFKQCMLEAADPSASYVRHMAYAINEAESQLSDLQLLDQLSRGGPDFLSTFRSQIHDGNIELLQSLLFSWVLDLDAGGDFPEVIQILAEYAPDFFKAKLKEHELPEWKLIASLGALGVNGAAIGKSDYPKEILTIYPSTLRMILRLREGDLFHARLALTSPNRQDKWEKGLPLLEPMLTETNSAARRLCVALYRTLGVPVERLGGGYAAVYAAAPASCPVTLRLSMEGDSFRMGEEVRFKVTETSAVDAGDFCFQGVPVATLHFVDHWHSPQSVPASAWENVALPREAYAELNVATTNQEELSVFRTIERPGTYRLSFAKCYNHDGGEHGLDAWTGVAFAQNELEFTVVEP